MGRVLRSEWISLNKSLARDVDSGNGFDNIFPLAHPTQIGSFLRLNFSGKPIVFLCNLDSALLDKWPRRLCQIQFSAINNVATPAPPGFIMWVKAQYIVSVSYILSHDNTVFPFGVTIWIPSVSPTTLFFFKNCPIDSNRVVIFGR